MAQEGWSFFFQAEDSIRDRNVTGVQTCALPISAFTKFPKGVLDGAPNLRMVCTSEIGRASCRERVLISGKRGRLKKTTKPAAAHNAPPVTEPCIKGEVNESSIYYIICE